MNKHVLVYADSLNKKSMEIEAGAHPIGYIEQLESESIERTAQVARECFGLRSDQGLRLRAIAPKELNKIEIQEGKAKDLHDRDFATIFEKSGAKPGRWIKVSDKLPEDEEDSKSKKKKPVQKRLFR